MMKRLWFMCLPLIAVVLTGCGDKQEVVAGNGEVSSGMAEVQPERWYTQVQVQRGDGLFQTHCAECHKPDASGTPDWRTPLANGKYPPPPLNGTAHTWHHPLSVLQRTVRIGGVPLGGTMPGFADKLNAERIDDILAWVQSRWPDETYRLWHERNTQAENRMQPIKKG